MELTPIDVQFLREMKIEPGSDDRGALRISREGFNTLCEALARETEATNRYRIDAAWWRLRALQSFGVLMVLVLIEFIRWIWS